MMIFSLLMDLLPQIRLWETSLTLLKITSRSQTMELLQSIAKLVLEEQELSSDFGLWSISKSQLRVSLAGLELQDQDQSLALNNSTFLRWSQTTFTPTTQLKRVGWWPKSWMRVPKTSTRLYMERQIKPTIWTTQNKTILRQRAAESCSTTALICKVTSLQSPHLRTNLQKLDLWERMCTLLTPLWSHHLIIEHEPDNKIVRINEVL